MAKINVQALIEHLADGKPIRKMKVDNVKVKVEDGSSVKTDGTLIIHAPYQHVDGIRHVLEAKHNWNTHEDQLTIDGLAKTVGLDIVVKTKPTITLGAIDAKIVIDWVVGATKREIVIYVKVADTLQEATNLGILLGL